MADPVTFRKTANSSTFRDSDGDTFRGTPVEEEEEVTQPQGLFGTGMIPLAVRLEGNQGSKTVTIEVRNLKFRSAIPGGFASAEIQLDRPLHLDSREIELYGTLFIYDGRNGNIVWQGRLEDPGRGATKEGEVWQIRAVGPSAHARDRQVKLIYVERSLERWQRIGAGNAASKGGMDEIILDANSIAALQLQAPSGLIIPANWTTGRWYRDIEEAGQKLARFSYDVVNGHITTLWKDEAIVRDSPGGPSTTVFSDNWNTVRFSKAAVVVADFPNGRAMLEIQIRFASATVPTASDTEWGEFRSIVVRSMLLDAEGNEITTGYTQDYILAHEVVKDLLGRLLPLFDGVSASIDETATTQIDQMAYGDGANPERILADLVELESDFYWAAWEDTGAGNRFEWRQWPTNVRYETDSKDGFTSPGSGFDVYNRVSVRWRDPIGGIKVEVRTATVPDLDDAGLTREKFIDLADEFGSEVLAQAVGDAFLAEHSSPPNAGTLEVGSPILDLDAGRMVAPWEIRPGHLIRVRDVRPRVDALNPTERDAVTIFRVVAVDYNADSNIASLELDSRPRTIVRLVAGLERRMDQLRKR